MANQKKMVKNLKASEDQFVGITGIIPAKHYATSSNYSSDSESNVGNDPIFGPYKDPVPPHNRNAQRTLIRERKAREKTPEPIIKEPAILEPSVSFRLHLKTSKPRIVGAIYDAPKEKGYRKAAKERREKQKEFHNFCQYDVVKVPSPSDIGYVRQSVKLESPLVSKAKVIPQRPSVVPDTLYPYPPTASQLEAKKPKSGIFLNEIFLNEDELSGPIQKKEPSKKKQLVKTEEEEAVSKIKTEEEEYLDFLDEVEGGYIEEIDEPSMVLEERTRKTVSLTSAQTSYNSKDIETFEDISWAKIPLMSKLVQTFRRENDEPVKKKPAKGSLENHSFTKLKQNVPQDFCFKSTHGTIHQGNENFSVTTRNRQGICMPVAAFCYAAIHRPKSWTSVMIDDIVELGEAFYLNCIAEFHVHSRKELKATELDKYVYIEDKRIKFKIEDPTINGDIRSKDKLVFNILKGLRIFFKRCRAGIIQAKNLNVVVWKQKKRYYMFDAVARRKDLQRDPNGTALLMTFQTITAIAAVLLDRSDLDDVAFNINHIKIVSILGKDEADEADVPNTHSVYNILSDKKAVVQGSFDLGDKCFQFSRNKQALTMAVVALVYARITPPSIWRRKTVDKIMIVGNQLYRECKDFENVMELKIQNLPAVFTIGPYMCEIFIYAGRFADNMYKKGVCVLCEALLEYFEDSTNAIVQIDRYYVAVWQQRGLYYVFDPYSRNSEALNCRRGTACVSMNSDIGTVIDTIGANFNEPNTVFYIHAVKVLKVHRDPALSRLFPKNATLNDVPIESFKRSRVRKSKKKAIERPVRTNFTEYAMKKLLAGEEPEPSILEIGSEIMSLNDVYLPAFVHTARKEIRAVMKEMDFVVDLDSASLSDTQLNKPIPCGCRHDDELTFQDLDSYQLTAEEIDLEDHGEDGLKHGAEEDEIELLAHDFGAEGGEDEAMDMEKYFVKDEGSHVNPGELEDKWIEEAMNTDLSYQYKVLPAIEFPLKRKKAKGITIDLEAQAEELKKPSHYKTKQDTFQILWAMGADGLLVSINNYSEYPEILAPYINIMATAFSRELAIGRWNKKHVEFLLRAGCQLYENYREEYKNIDDFDFEFQTTKFTVTIEKVVETFVGSELLHTVVGRQTIGRFLEQHIFNDSDMGIIIINDLCLSVFLKRNLFYMFDCYACNMIGSADEHSSGMAACVTRYPDLNNLLLFLTYNIQRREDENIDYGTYRKLILLKPRFTTEASLASTNFTSQLTSEPSMSITQSKELAKLTNFVDLPDDTQIVRGSTDVSNFGPDVEFIAPFVCVVTSAVASKYSIHTWSKQIVDYVIKCGSEVYKKSKVRFDQVSKLEIPKVSLGKTDYSVTVAYLLDSPMKPQILESCLRKVLKKEDYWAIIVTKTYSCACFCRNKLLYLYDPFPCNELGLSEGPNTNGFACLARFKTLKSLTERIIYNKNKHEHNDGGDKIEYTKFVLSMCKAKRIMRPLGPPGPRTNKRTALGGSVPYEDDQYEDEDALEEMPLEEEEEEEDGKGERKKEEENKIGYQKKKNIWVIEGTKSIAPVSSAELSLNEDHFISLVACLMAIDKPVAKWDTKRVDSSIDQGQHVFTHADNLEVSDKRTIKNILVGIHFFDIIVRMIHIALWRDNKNIETGLNTVLRKRKFVIVQFPNCAYVVFKDEGCVHLFSPYSSSHKVNKNETISVQAGWQKFPTVKRMNTTIRSKMAEGLESYYFYSFDVISVRKAPKKLLLRHRLEQYHLEASAKAEAMGKPFHEKEAWLNVHQSPWSRTNAENTASGVPRGRSDTKWHYWDIEYPKDLFSLIGTIHQISHAFKPRNRGKQTLANLVVAVGMTSIYEFSEWNAAVMDAILICGDAYFTECVKEITTENYELAVEDLKNDCTVFPYSFKVNVTPIVEGSMFVTNPRVFNLYKALRYFFEGFDRRCGYICAAKSLTEPSQPPTYKRTSASTSNISKIKRHLAFGKTGEKEYFLYDCQGYGQPMFVPGTGVGYALRCITQARLLHALVVTLRGGDFYVFEIATSDFKAIME